MIKKHNIKPNAILGHSDIAPERKKDPGEKFPWHEIAKNNLSLMQNLNSKKNTKLRGIKLSKEIEKKTFLNILKKIGYMKINSINS